MKKTKTLRELKTEKRKNEILREAINLLAEKGYERTTMEDVAYQLLMTKGSIYYYFENKEAMYFECNMMIIEQSIDIVQSIYEADMSSEEKIHRLIYEYILYQIEEKPVFSLANNLQHIFSEENFAEIVKKRDEFNSIVDKILMQGVENNEFKILDIKMSRFIIMGALNSIQSWYKPEGSKSVHEIAEIFSTELLKTLK